MTIQEIEKMLKMLIKHNELKIKAKNGIAQEAKDVSFEYCCDIKKYALIIKG